MKRNYLRSSLLFVITLTFIFILTTDSSILTLAEDAQGTKAPPGRRFLDKIIGAGPTSTDSTQDGSKSASTRSSGKVSAEDKVFFDQVKEEVKVCIDTDLPSAVQSCPKIRRGSKGKMAVDKQCTEIRRLETGLRCEQKILHRIPYRSRPAWNTFRAAKIQKDREKLNKLLARSKTPASKVVSDENWLREF